MIRRKSVSEPLCHKKNPRFLQRITRFFLSRLKSRPFFHIGLMLFLGGAFLLGLSACTQGGLQLIKQLEARELKGRILTERDMCFFDFVKQSDFTRCYEEASARLIAEECVEIRRTEPILQRDCENFLYRIVMKPDSMFPGHDAGEGFQSDYRIDDELNPDALGEVSREGGCDADQNCRDKCRDFFSSSDSRRLCYAYSTNAVDEIEKVFIAFRDPTTTDLNAINLRYLRVVLNISIGDVLEATWDADEKNTFLLWLATKTKTSSDPSVAKIFQDAERFHEDYELSEHLFEGINSGTTAMLAILNGSLTGTAGDDSFMDELLTSGNEEGLLWLHRYFVELYDQSDTDSGKRDIFRDIYCDLEFNSDNDEKYFDHDFFLDLLDNILANWRPSSSPPTWWEEDTTARDLSRDQWWQTDGVCYTPDFI